MKILFLSVSTCLFYSYVNAQSNIVAGGNQASGTGGSITYSIGQVDYSNEESTNHNYNEGVQQPFDVSPINNVSELTLEVSLYPNPSSESAILKIEGATNLGLQLELFDVAGKLISIQPIHEVETVLSLQELAAGNYTLRISNKTLIQDYKLIKY
jgi:opacity protein-like surface antigen